MTTGLPMRKLAVPLLVLWGVMVFASAVHQPFNLEYALRFFLPPQMAGWSMAGAWAALVGHARAFAGLAILDLGFAGLGVAVVSALGARVPAGLRPHLVLVAGQAVAAFLVFGLGALGLLGAPLVRAVSLAGAFGGAWALLRAFRRGSIRAFRPEIPGGIPGVLLALSVLAVVTALVGALAPQTSYDALTYYYAWPRHDLELHRSVAVPFVPYDGYPHSFENLFVPAFAFGGEVTAKLLNWQAYALACLGLAGFMKSRGVPAGPRAVAVSMFATLPVSGYLAMVTYNDSAVVHAALVALWLASTGRRHAAALVAGWLVGIKYSAVVVAVPLGLWALFPGRGIRWRALPLLFACAVPWWLRNSLVHGYPVYPLFWGAFPTFENREVIDLSANVTGIIGLIASRVSAVDWIALPWWAHLGPSKAITWEFSAIAVSPGPLWLLPIGLLLAEGRLRALALAAFALWIPLGGGLLRFLLPAVPWILAGAAEAVSRGGMARIAALSALPFACLQALFTWGAGYERVNPVAVVAGAETPVQHLTRIVGPVPHYMAVAGESPRLFTGGRTYVLGDVKAYYWRGDFLLDVIPIRPNLARWLAESDGPVRLRAKFRQANVRHLAYRMEGLLSIQNSAPRAYPWDARRLGLWQDFFGRTMELSGEQAGNDGTYYYFFDLSGRPARGWRSASAPFTLPGTELFTGPCDMLFLDGKRAEALGCFRVLAREWPVFEVPRRRLALLGGR